MNVKYYHGGAPKLKIILPASITGAHTTADYGADGICARNKVYVTTSYEAAEEVAALHPSDRGMVYEVEPQGILEHDPDCLQDGLSFQCDSAKVVRIFKIKTKHLLRLRRMILEAA